MRYTVLLTAAILAWACVGCNGLGVRSPGTELVSGNYVMRFVVPQLQADVTRPAAVSVFRGDLVINTFSVGGEPLAIDATMGWGGIKGRAMGVAGSQLIVIELEGKVLSRVTASGSFVTYRNDREAYRGEWTLGPVRQGRVER